MPTSGHHSDLKNTCHKDRSLDKDSQLTLMCCATNGLVQSFSLRRSHHQMFESICVMNYAHLAV